MSTLRVDTIQDRVGTGQPEIDGVAKAWVNFNGTGTVAIRASFNVTSITDNGTGDYTVNFTTAMSDANYAVTGNAAIGNFGSSINIVDFYSPNASSIRFQTRYHNGSSEGGSGTVYDYPYNFITVFR